MNISVLFTGGTIGSAYKENRIGVNEHTNFTLLRPFEGKDVVFDISTPYTILSENLSANELNLLQDALVAALATHPDGIIVTHGTDTLQYTAAALSLAFADASVPIVLVSAAYPLEDKRTNGYANMEGALAWIRHRPAGGVYVSYQNQTENAVTIHAGARLLQHAETAADLYSIGGAALATVTEGELTLGSLSLPRDRGMGPIRYTEDSGILVVESTPGNRYDYDLTHIRAIILKPYHSATLATGNERLGRLCRAAKARGIPVFLYGARNGTTYESSDLLKDLCIRVAPFGTFVSLYMKIWAAVSQQKDIPAVVQTRFAGEWAE